jgi:phosphatidylcholine synthase
MPVFGKNGATTKTYGVEPDSATGFGDSGEKKDACRGERDRAVGGI